MQLLGEGTAGVWRRSDALEVVSEGVIRAQLHDGSWHSPYPGVLCDGGIALDPVRWGFAGALASGAVFPAQLDPDLPLSQLGAVVCGRDSARVWGIPLVDDDDPATMALDRLMHDVCVWRKLDHLQTRPREGREVHCLTRHQLQLASTDVVRHPSGLWLTTRARTLFDVSLLVTHEALVCAIDACLHEGSVTRAELELVARRHKGWRGVRRFRAALDVADGRA